MEARYAVRRVQDVRYTDARDYRCAYDLYLPETDEAVPVLIYFYGGGLTKGAKDSPRAIPRALAEQGIAVIMPDYRLMPDVSYPAFIEDAADAVAHVVAHAGEYCRPTKFYVGGHSAGCYLSMMLAFDRHYLAERGIDAAALGGYVLLSGGTTKHFAILEHEGADKRMIRIDETCVLWHLRSDGAPLFVVSGDSDMPTRCAENRLFVAALKRYDYSAPIVYREYNGVKHSDFVRISAETGEIPVLADLVDFIAMCEPR